MEYIDPQLLDPSSTDGEAEISHDDALEVSQPAIDYPQDDGFLFQGWVPSYPLPYADFASPYPSPYPETPLQPFGYNFFNPHAPISGPLAPDLALPMFPHAPVYPNFAAPPFPANYPQGPEQVSPPRLLESTPEVNKYFTRLQARKAVHPRNPGQSKNLGRKRQPRRPNVKRLSQPLCPSEELKLSKPLSELALDAPHIPVHDIDAYILRSPDKRISRTGLRVSRPSNAFVLYRKAYSEQIKAMIGTNKNALVSKYAGASWQMEGREIKDKFSKLARAEKRQHLACFPDYKYNPGKTRRPRHSEEATETESDNELALDEIFSDIV